MTDKPKSIFAALAKAQSEMGKALKSAANPHFKSKYADLSEVMDACLPALNANGIAVYQPMREGDAGRYVVTILAHDGGETIECAVPLIVQKNDMQGLGSAITYARRYGLMSMAGIAPEDDDGNAAANAAPKGEAPVELRDTRKAEPMMPDAASIACDSLNNADTLAALQAIWADLPPAVRGVRDVIDAKDRRKAALQTPSAILGDDDHIPYDGK